MPYTDHDDLLTIIGSAPDTLSPEIVPYLFAQLSESETESDRVDILSSIDRLFPWGYDGSDVDLAWLADRFSGFAKKIG